MIDGVLYTGREAAMPAKMIPMDTGKEEIGKCPKCGQPVFERDKLYHCADRSCSFVLFKDNRYLASMKKKLTKKMVKDFLKEGKTYVPDLYSQKKNKTFGAMIVMDASGKYPSFALVFDRK